MTLAHYFSGEWIITTAIALGGLGVTLWRFLPDIIERRKEARRGICLDCDSYATVFADKDDPLPNASVVSRSGATSITPAREIVRIRVIVRGIFHNTSKRTKSFKTGCKVKLITENHGEFEAVRLNHDHIGTQYYTISPGEYREAIEVFLTERVIDGTVDHEAIAADTAAVEIRFGNGGNLKQRQLPVRKVSNAN